MSAASKCDRCGALYVPTKGTLTLTLHVNKDDENSHSWSDVDFCLPCSGPVLAAVGEAIDLVELDH
jgi:hypothetical protein